MYALKSLALLGLALVSASAAKDTTHTTVGIETDAASRGLNVVLDDCFDVDEEDVYTVSVRKYCRVFTGPFCTGRNTLLPPGDHSNQDPVPITSIYCHSKPPF
ncbi:hypothetical protein N7468_002643 [Penicillium chermesinum]|uniref:Uncharacterized protein n=1 Tax=Penicillium chermesinum TaxID=63820 RepID=A0A9W9TXU3_9EURO|nr:uncharacterized protein N7468_002643 [Penicillium chermesinum]KAJ5247660.1 hypothetical protein N7468_002643 [Penicillium chermesinum]KAJ6151426.1 hypothetical protein N7470_007023 [Penicillium chermesinum]